MPYFSLFTNVSGDKVTQELLKSTSKVIAKTLGKPESYVVVHIVPDQKIIFGGSDAPCGQAVLMSIGQLGIEENKKHARVIYEHLEKELGIPNNRCYITFQDAPASTIGYNGSTFHDLFGHD